MKEKIRHQIEFAYRLSYEDLNEDTKERVKEVILDSIGCIALGKNKNIQGSLEDRIFDYARAMVSTELYEGNRFAIGHPAIHIMPVMLAVCGEENVFSKRFITVFAAAYEIAARWGASIAFSNTILGHGTVMTAAAAVAYGLLTGADEEELYEAVLIAASLPCVSVWQSVFDGSELHDCYTGLAGMIGVRAVKMAQEGVRCTEEMVKEVYETVMGATLRLENMDKGLGEDFWINRNYFKIHTGCRFIHPFADILSGLMEEGLTADEVERMEVYTYKKAARLTAQAAQSEVEAKFSTPVSLAILLYCGKLTHTSVHEYIANETVKELAHRIFLMEEDVYNRLLPDKRGGRLVVYKKNGEILKREVFHAKGDYDNPHAFTQTDVIAKFRDNTAGRMPKEQQDEWIALLTPESI
ncbi:MAG: MmgE/PrpD family protein [Roseburia sp.]|nr:MmgE/PrpD family protein [Roseburia sp.]